MRAVSVEDLLELAIISWTAQIKYLSNLFAQSFNGPESVDYDSYGKRYLVSNSSQGQILSYDAINDELDVLL